MLQQERHALERKLATVEGEHESHLEELCSEIDRLQDGLARHQISNKKTEQEKEEYIGELLQHNQRIGMELKQVMVLQNWGMSYYVTQNKWKSTVKKLPY